MFLNLKKTIIYGLLSILLIHLLSACGESPKRWDWDPQGYSVKKGDTLYSIAWRYEKDYRQIALWNNIQAPFAIYPGQRLVMQGVNKDGPVVAEDRPQVLNEANSQQVVIVEEAKPVYKPVPVKAKPTHTQVNSGDTLYSIARREGFTHHQIARWNHLKAPYLLRPGQKLRLSPSLNALGQKALAQNNAETPSVSVGKPQSQNTIQAKPLAAAKPVIRVASTGSQNNALPTKVDKWRWPVKGRVVKTYKANDTSRKGIGIKGKSGQSINAAAGGTVVYSGNGLINYGNLIIIKHSHSFLSAYAHNKSLLVKEGDSVKSGQAIAKIGKNEAGKPQLHFEIRRNGKPVNPLNYLPKT